MSGFLRYLVSQKKNPQKSGVLHVGHLKTADVISKRERKKEGKKRLCLVYPFGTFWSCSGLVCLHVHESDSEPLILGI